MTCLLNSTINLASEVENLSKRSSSLRIRTETAIKEGQQMIKDSSKSLQKTIDVVGKDLFDKYKLSK